MAVYGVFYRVRREIAMIENRLTVDVGSVRKTGNRQPSIFPLSLFFIWQPATINQAGPVTFGQR